MFLKTKALIIMEQDYNFAATGCTNWKHGNWWQENSWNRKSTASGYIKAHSHPEEQHALPTMNDLKADFERFKVIENDFKN